MTFIGKLLVVVQVVLSICFMAFAAAVYTSQNNWKAQAETFESQVQSLQSDLNRQRTDFDAQKTAMDKALTGMTNRAETAETALATMTAQHDALVAQHDKLTTEYTEQRAVAQLASNEAAMRKEDVSRERARNADLHNQLEEKNAQIAQLEDSLFNNNLMVKALNEKHLTVLDQLAFLDEIVRKNDLSTDPDDYVHLQLPPPRVKGTVLNTRTSQRSGTEFVEVSLGKDDGVERGHELHILRAENGGKYVAKIEVVYVTPDRCVGTVVVKAKNAEIEEGDNVTSKL
ncbi:MAG: hypothetical protein ACREIV_03580 [Planctomycetaceae bacterium]